MASPSNAQGRNSLPQEREAKFALDRHADVAALQACIAGYGATFGAAESVTHVDTYLDTPSFDLYRRGLSLRLRRHGDTRELGLKQTGYLDQATTQDRTDFSTPLAPDATLSTPRRWPEAMVKELKPLVGKLSSLQPLVELHQTRHKQIVMVNERATETAEWSLDQVTVHLPTADDGDCPPLDTFTELELELLVPEDDDVFQQWASALENAEGVQPAAASKFVRGLDLVLQQRCQAVAVDAGVRFDEYPLAEACRLILCQQLRVLLSHEAGVRHSDDPEFVHEMRVAIRRSRAALRLFGDRFRTKVIRHYQQEFKALARKLGAVRDLDVALENLAHFRRRLPKDTRAQLRPLRKTLRQERRKAHTDLVAHLDGDAHRAFIADFAAFCTSAGAGIKPAKDAGEDEVSPTQVRHTMPGIIWRCFEEVRAYETVLAGSDLPPLPVFHALRIRAKYLRYSLEFAADHLGEPGATLIAQLKTLQDHLGALNDAHVEQQRLDDWAAALDDKEVIALRARALDATVEELMAAAPAKLAQLNSPHCRLLLGQALARL